MSNLILTPAAVNSVTVPAGTTLFQVAAAQLGDATMWNQISDINPSLNGDPLLTSLTTLNIPTTSTATNGGLIDR